MIRFLHTRLGFTKTQAFSIFHGLVIVLIGLAIYFADLNNTGLPILGGAVLGAVYHLILVLVPHTNRAAEGAYDTMYGKQSASAQTDDDDDQHLGIGS